MDLPHIQYSNIGYCRNKDCKYHIHLFEPDVEKKKNHQTKPQTFLEVKASEKTNNLVMLYAEKTPSQPHLQMYLEQHTDFGSQLGTEIKSLMLGLVQMTLKNPFKPNLFYYYLIKHANSHTHTPKPWQLLRMQRQTILEKKMNIILIFQSKNCESETMTPKVHTPVQGPKPFMVVA